ncbi:MAG: SAM-dependent methyltransferase [Nanoarchaeota archaeon]|nr:SAM-dependent methyltransferase [Nanoarchaeota archaeon]
MKWVIEHLEPEVFPWCVLEYKHITQIVGKKNLVFTNVKKGAAKLKSFGQVYKQSIRELFFTNACVLDPIAEQQLNNKDHFDYIVLGGILGDHPPRARTKEELSQFVTYPTRNLGKKQFSTDTAVLVAQALLEGKKLQDLPLQEGISLQLNKVESVDLPFTYLIKNGQPVLPAGLKQFLRKRQEF